MSKKVVNCFYFKTDSCNLNAFTCASLHIDIYEHWLDYQFLLNGTRRKEKWFVKKKILHSHLCCRHPPRPAASNLRWQAAGGRSYPVRLQHPER